MPLDPDQLDPDPLAELARWIGDAERAGHRLATSFALATADARGRPSVRMVLLRGIEADLAASQSIFGQSPFGFLLLDTELKIRRANERFALTFGGTVDDHRGRTVRDYLTGGEVERVAPSGGLGGVE